LERPAVPRKIQKRREHFVQVPWRWVEKLKGAASQTWYLAHHLLYLHWKGGGEPIKLANGMLEFDGISRQSKWRALGDLERRGLIMVERRPKRSPIVRLNLSRI
jgi:hypothetical protein